MKYLKLVSVILLTAYFVSCKTIQPQAPVESYVPVDFKPMKSEIPIKISLDMKQLENAINRQLSGQLFEAEKLNNMDLAVKVWKAGPVTFTVNGQSIDYKIPLRVWVNYGWKVNTFGVELGDHYEAEGSIELSYKTNFQIDNNWKLVTKTNSTGFKWLKEPRLKVAGVKLPVTNVMSYALKSGNELISKEIDNNVAAWVDVRKYISDTWNYMQNPILVYPDNKVWLKVTPVDLSLTPFRSRGNIMELGVVFTAMFQTVVGEKPATTKSLKLPAYKNSTVTSNEFKIQLSADMTMAEINKIAREQLLNKSFSDGKRTITIKDLHLYGSEGKLVCKTDLTGSVKGSVYFTGNLAFDPAQSVISIQEPAFDVNTKNALLKSADWLMHGTILNKIKPYLTFSIKSELDKLKLETNKNLKSYELYPGVKAIGNVKELSVESVQLVPGAIRVVVDAKGDLQIKMDQFNF